MPNAYANYHWIISWPSHLPIYPTPYSIFVQHYTSRSELMIIIVVNLHQVLCACHCVLSTALMFLLPMNEWHPPLVFAQDRNLGVNPVSSSSNPTYLSTPSFANPVSAISWLSNSCCHLPVLNHYHLPAGQLQKTHHCSSSLQDWFSVIYSPQ